MVDDLLIQINTITKRLFRQIIADCPLIAVFDRAITQTNLPISLIFDPRPVDNRAK
jgi:hypothetical protein